MGGLGLLAIALKGPLCQSSETCGSFKTDNKIAMDVFLVNDIYWHLLVSVNNKNILQH